MGFAHCIRAPPLGARSENNTGPCFEGAGAERRSWGIGLMPIPQVESGFAHCIRAPPLGARPASGVCRVDSSVYFRSRRASFVAEPAMSKACAILLLAAFSLTAVSAEGDVTVLAAPKALAAGAVSEDWPSFLGPRHNSTSTETHLLKAWPKTGPTLLWSLVKGTGYASPAIRGDALVYVHR